MSRNNIERHITLHPKGAGPAQEVERSIGHTTGEMAVWSITFRPLMVTEEAGLDDGQYYKSWVE
jgi:hypothetical protein